MKQRSRESPPTPLDTGKMDRKTVEKNRRIHMKGLCFKLTSLIRPSPHLTPPSKVDQLELATNYIVQLRQRVELLKEQKAKATLSMEEARRHPRITNDTTSSLSMDSRFPIIDLRDLGSSLELTLISRLQKNFMLFQVVSVLEEEGLEVVGINMATLGDMVYHILHAQVKSPRVGVETSIIGGKLHELVSSFVWTYCVS